MKHANALLLSWKLCPKSLFYFFFIFLFLFFLIFFCCNGFWKLLLRPKCLLTRDCTRVLRCYPGMTPCWSSLKFVSQVSWLLLLFVVVTAVILINYEFGVVADFIPDVIELSLTEDDLRDYMSVVILEMVKRLFFTSQLNVFY